MARAREGMREQQASRINHDARHLPASVARSDGITCSKPTIRAHLIVCLGAWGCVFGRGRKGREEFGRRSKEIWQAVPNRPGSPETNPQGCACALIDSLETWLAMHELHSTGFSDGGLRLQSSGWSGDLRRSYALS